MADGMHDLGALVDGGLPANGWEALASSLFSNGLGQITGNGKRVSQSGGQMGYLLTPVPEPATLVLLGCSVMLLPRRICRSAVPREQSRKLVFAWNMTFASNK